MSLPSWPKKPQEWRSREIHWRYERLMKEAYAARLRLAVEALRQYESTTAFDMSACSFRPYAREALAAIGEVPQG